MSAPAPAPLQSQPPAARLPPGRPRALERLRIGLLPVLVYGAALVPALLMALVQPVWSRVDEARSPKR